MLIVTYAECLYAECHYAECRGAPRFAPQSGKTGKVLYELHLCLNIICLWLILPLSLCLSVFMLSVIRFPDWENCKSLF
jgi:hypothetical protein